MIRAEVVVVGGGPVGLATAIAAKRRGLDVLIVERRRPPIDKACGEGLMPDALARLVELGVDLPPGTYHPFYGIRWLDGEIVVEGRFARPSDPDAHGAGVRRLRLHDALARRAEEVGVRCVWETRVERIDLEEGRLETTGGDLKGDWIVGADGLRSRVRRAAMLDGKQIPAEPKRFGVRRHFALRPWTDHVEVYWADDCEAYVTPTAADEVGTAILWSPGTRDRKTGFDELLENFPALAERLRGAEATSRDRGCGPLRQRTRGVVRGRTALVGDAAGYVDAITGEGLAVGLHQAVDLAEALAAGDLQVYARRNRRIVAWPNGITRLLLQVERRPWLRRGVLRALARTPGLFSRILAVHGGVR